MSKREDETSRLLVAHGKSCSPLKYLLFSLVLMFFYYYSRSSTFLSLFSYSRRVGTGRNKVETGHQ